METKQPIIVLVGETASGKTSLALDLAQQIDGEIIAADSRTVYRGMDIATAKPSRSEQLLVKHWCIDIRERGETYSVADFMKEATKAITDIHNRGKVPIVVGGTGLYVEALVYGYELRPISSEIRRNLEAKTLEEVQILAKQVAQTDLTPDTLGNKRRLIRLVEAGGSPRKPKELPTNMLFLGLALPLEQLKQQIQERVVEMLNAGLRDEYKAVSRDDGLTDGTLTINAYQVLRDAENLIVDDAELVTRLVTKDLQLAKKQRTWFKRDANILWYDTPDKVKQVIVTWLAKFS